MSGTSDVVIEWDRKKLEEFKKLYASCTEDVFVFEGHEFLKSYAKYLIEFLESKIRK